ncbi:hypothetical protein Pla22_19780 [Rubripirellula amarantea]|uniref:Uncharacterized protein n=1 Tax=Rubripirellula amarantea TaxID=2527999 RepID=A0A5C5WWT9_9BACT|nr:hypothetical protein Pla22_19780 [Rubripirellula amarantea]
MEQTEGSGCTGPIFGTIGSSVNSDNATAIVTGCQTARPPWLVQLANARDWGLLGVSQAAVIQVNGARPVGARLVGARLVGSPSVGKTSDLSLTTLACGYAFF